ncbi:MAG: hypothetical protein CVU84_16865 [Firmicutes bacterium HGW-Firmicutes-1]|jgi:hypothetical protein|nr:MAG: hypothetical protein CVU84_16865 [Firmicutes bacterium HGW-Firmicutes-1]
MQLFLKIVAFHLYFYDIEKTVVGVIYVDSIKERLKNQDLGRGHLFQEEITAYGLGRTIYRILIS